MLSMLDLRRCIDNAFDGVNFMRHILL